MSRLCIECNFLLCQLSGPFIISFHLSLSLWYTVFKVVFWSIIAKPLITTSIHWVFGRPKSFVLFILLTKTFSSSWPSALHPSALYTCLNHSSRFILLKENMFGLLLSLSIIASSIYDYSSGLNIGPFMVYNTFLSNLINLLLSSLVHDLVSLT